MMRRSPLVGIDPHCHLSFLTDEDLVSLVSDHPNFQWIVGGYDSEDWKRQIQICKKFPKKVKTSFGLHPWVIREKMREDIEKEWDQFLFLKDQADWVGETGLDFYPGRTPLNREMQREYFRRHLESEQNKPFVLHVVKAHGETLKVLDEFPGRRGFVHAFQGAYELIREYKKRGFLVSFGQGLLKLNNTKIQKTLKEAPWEGFLIESDAPRGKDSNQNPIDIFSQVAQKVADIKNVSIEKVLLNNSKNLSQLIS